MGNVAGVDSVKFVSPSASVGSVQPAMPSWTYDPQMMQVQQEQTETDNTEADNTETVAGSQTIHTHNPALEGVTKGVVKIFEDDEPLNMGATVTLLPLGKYVGLPDTPKARRARLSHKRRPQSDTEEKEDGEGKYKGSDGPPQSDMDEHKLVEPGEGGGFVDAEPHEVDDRDANKAAATQPNHEPAKNTDTTHD